MSHFFSEKGIKMPDIILVKKSDEYMRNIKINKNLNN